MVGLPFRSPPPFGPDLVGYLMRTADRSPTHVTCACAGSPDGCLNARPPYATPARKKGGSAKYEPVITTGTRCLKGDQKLPTRDPTAQRPVIRPAGRSVYMERNTGRTPILEWHTPSSEGFNRYSNLQPHRTRTTTMTNQYLLSGLPEHIAYAAAKNTAAYSRYRSAHTVAEALARGFSWAATEQRSSYWEGLHTALTDALSLFPPPQNVFTKPLPQVTPRSNGPFDLGDVWASIRDEAVAARRPIFFATNYGSTDSYDYVPIN